MFARWHNISTISHFRFAGYLLATLLVACGAPNSISGPAAAGRADLEAASTASAGSASAGTVLTSSTAMQGGAPIGDVSKSSTLTMPKQMQASNTMLVTNPTSASISNYPLEIGRVFKQGEIAKCPDVYVNGAVISAQIDAKNRWEDGSLRFAVVSMVLPSIGANERLSIEFKSGAQCSTVPGLSADQLLNNFDFDSRIVLNGDEANSASARDMLSAGAYWRWTDGPINTTAIVEDHVGKRYDFGSDANRSLRPIFHVQFWPSANVYRVRVIVEQSDTTKLQNQDYSVRVSVGRAAPQVVYERSGVPHVYATRWTRDFWVGRNLPELGIQHNVGYLANTGAIPNFDSRFALAASAKTKLLTDWAKRGKDIYDAGSWTKAMPTTGGRAEIGLFPSWQVAALYDGDAALWSMARRQADLAGAWSMHFRSGDPRTFDEKTGASGMGRVVTHDSHPTQFLYSNNAYMNMTQHGVKAADLFNYLGPALPTPSSTDTTHGWIGDSAHQPDAWYLTYLTTGEWWYLEELQFWASWGLFAVNPGSSCWASGRSPKDTVIHSEVRGDAWLLRTRARAAYASPDGSPEQAYFRRATEQALRAWEGQRIGMGADPIRAYWALNRCPPPSENVLHLWGYAPGSDGTGYTSGGPPDMKLGQAPWMQHFVIVSLAHAKELGFNAGDLLSWAAKFTIGLATEPGVDPRHLADYFVPVTKNITGTPFFQSWVDAFDDWSTWSSTWDSMRPDLEHGYTNIATAASAVVAGEMNGAVTWNWVYQNNYATQDWTKNPKWAILPR